MHRLTGRSLRARLLIAALALCALALAPTAASAATASDFQQIRDRYYEYLIGDGRHNAAAEPFASKLAAINTRAQWLADNMDTTPTDYLWNDDRALIRNDRDPAYMQQSYERLREMAIAHETVCTPGTGCLYQNRALLAKITLGLDFIEDQWFGENVFLPSGMNWYGFRIGAELALTDTMVLLEDHLTTTQKEKYLAAMADKMYATYPSGDKGEGANRAWEVKNYLIYGALKGGMTGGITDGEAKVELALDGMADLLVYTATPGNPGFFWDGSFFQHGYHPYSGGYGTAQLAMTLTVTYVLDGHPLWEVTDSNVRNLAKWAIDAYQPLIYRGSLFDFMRGRAIGTESDTDRHAAGWVMSAYLDAAEIATSLGQTSYAGTTKRLAKEWITKDSEWYADRYTSFGSVRRGKALVDDAGVTASGDQQIAVHYPMMYKSFSHRPGYAFGLSMNGPYSYNYESSSENIAGWHQADGMTLLYVGDDVRQYREAYWPTVNSYRLPGTTVQLNTTIPQDVRNAQNWVGGTSDGTYGVSGMHLAPTGQPISARKSWFMLDDEIVALGTDVAATGGKTVETVIDNRRLNSSGGNAFTVDGTAKSTTTGRDCTSYRGWSETMSSVRWMHLAGTTNATGDLGYYFPSATTVKGLRARGCGYWHDINSDYGDSTTLHQNHFLQTWLDHGTDPTAGSYAYALLPGYSSSATQTYRNSPEFSVVRQDSQVHAVKETTQNIVAANFWDASTQSINVGSYRPWVTTNSKLTFLAREYQSSGVWYMDVAVADPTRANTDLITVEFGFPVASSGHTIPAGMTVVQTTPTLKFRVDANGSEGGTWRARFRQ